MTRRLVLAILGTTVAAVVLAGAGTLLLVRSGDRHEAEREVRSDAIAVADGLADIAPGEVPFGPARRRPFVGEQRFSRGLLEGVRRALDLADLTVLAPADLGGTEPPLTDGERASLREGETVSGHRSGVVFAAAPSTVGGEDVVVFVARPVERRLAAAFRWFLLAAVVVGTLAVLVALRLARRLTRPVREISAVTSRIAEGDLDARLGDAEGDDEMADLARSVNAMAESLQRSRLLEQQFLLSVSHDLRTPLTSIRGYAEALRDGALDDPASAGPIIEAEARRLERLVGDLLDLARLEARAFSLHPAPVDLSALAAEAATGLRPAAAEAGVEIDVTAPPEPLVVEADPDRVRQVLANLLENGIRYAASRVRLELGREGDAAVVWVTDDGPGIPADDLPHVFERLYVARHRPRRRETGSGLGLAIVRQLVQAMGGRASAVSSAAGSGARFEVRLMLVRTDPAATGGTSAPSSAPRTPLR